MRNGPFDLGGLTATALAKRVWAEISDDNVWDAAAQLGYYFLLALFPMLIFLLSLVALVPNVDLVAPLLGTLRSVMPPSAYELVGTEIQRILASSNGGLLTFGMFGTIWAASSGVVSLIGTLNRAYEVDETRGLVKLRFAAVGITVALVVLLVTGGVLLTAGDAIAEWGAALLGLDWVARIAGTAISYLLGFALLFLALEVVYYFGPDVDDQKWHWITPGSLVGVLLFVAASIGFTLYLRFNDTYSVTYGSIGAVIVLMLWLYLLGLSIVVGAEVNSEIAIAAKARGREDAPDDVAGAAERAHVVALPQPKNMSPEVYGLVLSDLLGALVHENARVRAATARMLTHLEPRHPAVEALLEAALQDEDGEVRAEARRALDRLHRAA